MAMLKRRLYQLTLAAMLVALTGVAAQLWTSSYEKHPDPRARYQIQAVKVERDRSFCWLEVHLKKSGEKSHDLLKPVLLRTAKGKSHEPANTTFQGNPEAGFSEIWFKFWIEESELSETLQLRLNDAELCVKSSAGLPALGKNGRAVFRSTNWRKSWLGF
jgi:hypothetical protein